MKNTWREVNKILGKGNKADILENCSDWQEVDSNHRDIDNSLIIIIIIIIIHPIIIPRSIHLWYKGSSKQNNVVGMMFRG